MESLDIHTTEMHTGGEPVRIFEANFPKFAGRTLLEKRTIFRENYDFVRQALMREPRGHRDMYGAAIVQPDLSGADLAVLFLQNEGYSPMCGHAVIALGRYAVDKGLVQRQHPVTEVNIQCPCGLVKAKVECDGDGKTSGVSFRSVPAFLYKQDLTINVRGKTVILDVAFGGAFYAIIPASELHLDFGSLPIQSAIDHATAVTEEVKKAITLTHPESDDLAYLYGTIITDGKDDYSADPTSNICVFADKQVDRSPTGSGVTARIAAQFTKKQIDIGQCRHFRSCIGTTFTGTPVEQIQFGQHKAVIVNVSGKAYYTGTSYFTAEIDDPLALGFLLNQ